MKSISHLLVFENQTDITAENIADFFKRNNELINKTVQTNNLSNNLSEAESTQQAVSCLDYCDSHMRDIFDDYRGYHGYVTLVVSNNFQLNDFISHFIIDFVTKV